jgi:hypothetical protein
MGMGGKVTVSAGTDIRVLEDDELNAVKRFSLIAGQKAAIKPLKIRTAKIPSHTFQDSVRLKLLFSDCFPQDIGAEPRIF